MRISGGGTQESVFSARTTQVILVHIRDENYSCRKQEQHLLRGFDKFEGEEEGFPIQKR